jgi:hypothetical protein
MVKADGYSSRRSEITVADAVSPVTLQVDPELHFEEVVSVGGEARSQFDSLQPTSVLAGQELAKQLGSSLGQTPRERDRRDVAQLWALHPARPVIRGLDGDRVLILQDGQRMGDLSSQSGDHGVAINPVSAQRIEVVRGPATLLYGANAIGGLVNVITNDIPTRSMSGVHGNTTIDLGSAASEAGGAADIVAGNGTFAVHAGGGGRHSGDVDTPLGPLTNSQSRNGFGNVGAAWTGKKGYFGGSYGYDDTKYGIPVVEDGQVELTPRRHAFSLRGGGENLTGAFDSFRATMAVRRYTHDELAGGAVGHVVHQQYGRARVPGLAPQDWPAQGQPGCVVSRSCLRCARRGGARASRRSARLRRIHLRGAHLAARDGAVRGPRGAFPLRTERRDGPQFHHRIGLAGPALPPGWGGRSRDGGPEPRPCGADSGTRRAVLLRHPRRQLRLRGGQSRTASRARARVRRRAAVARAAWLG